MIPVSFTKFLVTYHFEFFSRLLSWVLSVSDRFFHYLAQVVDRLDIFKRLLSRLIHCEMVEHSPPKRPLDYLNSPELHCEMGWYKSLFEETFHFPLKCTTFQLLCDIT